MVVQHSFEKNEATTMYFLKKPSLVSTVSTLGASTTFSGRLFHKFTDLGTNDIKDRYL